MRLIGVCSQRTACKSLILLDVLGGLGGASPLDTRHGILTIVKIKDPDARRAALSLIRRGIITVPEAAELAGVSRQVVHYWCRAAGVVAGQSRSAVLAKAWRRAMTRA
jgi:hypothetical protein